MSKVIPLFFWSSTVFEKKTAENYGDLLSSYIVEKVSGKKTRFYNAPKLRKKWFQPTYLMAIGSIMSYTSRKAWVWGSGIISRDDTFSKARFCAVRGPLSRKRILELGYDCPEVYGDPALLLPEFYKPEATVKYKIGIIPHYVDYKQVQQLYGEEETVTVIDLMTNDHFKTTDQIRACQRVVSSSLHGVIVAQAYGIPAVWVRFSDRLSGDNVKFEDYFRSVAIVPYTGAHLTEKKSLTFFDSLFKKYPSSFKMTRLKEIQEALLQAFPKI
jgi:hypothetical protein